MQAINVQITTTGIEKIQKTFSFQEGQIVKAQIVEAQGNKAILKIGNILVSAETMVPLTKGEKVQLLVTTWQKEIVRLKLIPNGEIINPEKIILSRLGFKQSDILERVIKELLKFKMPVNQEIIREISNLIKGRKLPIKYLPLLVWLKSVGVKISDNEDIQQLNKLMLFLEGELPPEEEGNYLNLLNNSASAILGGYNVYSWSWEKFHLYLLLENAKGKGKEIDPETCTLIVKACSRALGDLWFKINYLDNNLKVFVTCSNEQQKKLLKKEGVILQQNLESAGYRVSEIVVEIGKIHSVFDFLPQNYAQINSVNYKI